VDPVSFRIEAYEQFGQHRYDTNQHFFAGLNAIQRGKSFGRRGLADRILEKLDQLKIIVRIQRNLPSLQPVLLYSASIS
jgi:hypothetical protein